MLKSFVILLNVIAFMGYRIIFGGDVTVNQEMPEQVNPGETFTIEVSIDKGEIGGFAKWQQKLPEGFTAVVKEKEGATFSFKDNTVKLIWMVVPSQANFKISYDVTVDESVKGWHEIEGKFSYIIDNSRKDVSSKSRIHVGELADNEESTLADESASKQKGKKKVVKEIGGNRTITSEGPNSYMVSIELQKNELNSFGKLEEYIPEGYVAKEVNASEAMFSFREGTAKFLWMALPEDSALNISYTIENVESSEENPTVNGEFSYLEGEESKRVPIEASSFDPAPLASETEAEGGEEMAENTANEETAANEESNEVAETVTEVEEVTDEGIETATAAIAEEVQNEAEDIAEVVEEDMEAVAEETEEVVEEITESDNSEDSQEDLTEAVSGIPSPESGVAYKVQIAAGKKEVAKNYFEKRHRITEAVAIEFHDGWRKYTIGQFPVYKEARDRRNEVWEADNKISDAFVTAYNSGERISVQEALMISQQKWFR